MATYIIGDVHGCLHPLKKLLDKINYTTSDKLWFTGDIINRGPNSLETLQFIKSLGSQTNLVLGNHELALLRDIFISPDKPYLYCTREILAANDIGNLIQWVCSRPIIHIDHSLQFILVHAGLPPQWDILTCLSYGQEIEQLLQGPADTLSLLLEKIFEDIPSIWNNNLECLLRYRYIISAFTRIRLCDNNGTMDLQTKDRLKSVLPNQYPWFELYKHLPASYKVFFGHWSTLNGQTNSNIYIGLDTGCVWGGKLSAYNVEEQKLIQV